MTGSGCADYRLQTTDGSEFVARRSELVARCSEFVAGVARLLYSMFGPRRGQLHAGVVKLADAPDSKSGGVYAP